MNMIRVWGGGIYEQEIFYDLCDHLGLMVWQDFMFACGEYPDHPAFLEEVRTEAEYVVRRLRNHPCIVLWCGNNECEWLFCTTNPAKGPDDMRGAPIFREVLPRVVREQDGTRPYWRSTPFGEGSPNAQDNGNHHQWEVWSAWKDFLHYRENHARFVSEFGFQGPPDPRTLERVTLPEDRSLHSAVVEHHNKQVEGMERLFRFQAAHYPVAADWDGFFHTGQLVQADALKCAVEHWRRRKFNTGGALFWQLNDCWPVMSWSVIDVDFHPKAAYYAARRFFAPVLVSLAATGPDLEVWGTNDLLAEVPSRLSLSLRSFSGDVLWHKNMRVVIPPNASCILYTVPGNVMNKVVPETMYVHAALTYAGGGVTENRHFFREPKHLRLPRARIAVSVRKSGPGVYRASVRSTKFALGVALTSTEVNAYIHENWFDLDPGSPRDVTISSELSLASLRRAISVRAFNS
jgi:beta-mannosidase